MPIKNNQTLLLTLIYKYSTINHYGILHQYRNYPIFLAYTNVQDATETRRYIKIHKMLAIILL